MKVSEIAALAQGLAPFVHDVVGESITPLTSRLAEIEARPAVKDGDPGPQGEIGPAGPQGEPGPPGEISRAVVPPELAAEVAIAVRMLHELPPLAEP
jgi:hypothetical protein